MIFSTRTKFESSEITVHNHGTLPLPALTTFVFNFSQV